MPPSPASLRNTDADLFLFLEDTIVKWEKMNKRLCFVVPANPISLRMAWLPTTSSAQRVNQWSRRYRHTFCCRSLCFINSSLDPDTIWFLRARFLRSSRGSWWRVPNPKEAFLKVQWCNPRENWWASSIPQRIWIAPSSAPRRTVWSMHQSSLGSYGVHLYHL